jgi:hypothetical protein
MRIYFGWMREINFVLFSLENFKNLKKERIFKSLMNFKRLLFLSLQYHLRRQAFVSNQPHIFVGLCISSCLRHMQGISI